MYIPHDPETNRRIWEASREQATAHNRTIEYLLDHPDEPLRSRRKTGHVGLYGRWNEWRAESPQLAEMAQATWRGGVAAAKARVDQWEETNSEHAELVIKRSGTDEPIPKRVQRRIPDADTLFIRRKDADRRGNNRFRVLEGVRRKDKHTLHVPGIGQIQTKEQIPETMDLRAATLIERTPPARRRQPNLQPEERTWKINLHHRVVAGPVPAKLTNSVGIDHGVVHAMTTCDSNGNVEHYQHDDTERNSSEKRSNQHQRKADRQCRKHSRKWKQRKRQAWKVRSRQLGRNAHRRLQWANRLAQRFDAVCVEDLQVANLLRSAAGTHENPGKNVAAKSGLARKLAGIAPSTQTTAIEAACLRHGAHFAVVNAHNTSISCSTCYAVDAKSRESQAVFICTKCGHATNADANAAENVRRKGVAIIRARVSGSRGNPKRRAAGQHGGTATEAPASRRDLNRTQNSAVRQDRELKGPGVTRGSNYKRKSTTESRLLR